MSATNSIVNSLHQSPNHENDSNDQNSVESLQAEYKKEDDISMIDATKSYGDKKVNTP
jgi:hypothetical protein